MEPKGSPPVVVSPEAVYIIGSTAWIAPASCFMSGYVFLQYANFCINEAPKKSPLAFRLASCVVLIHIGQICIELWIAWEGILHLFIAGTRFTIILFESLQAAFTAGIVLIVQNHFARIAYTMVKSKMLLILATTISMIAFLAAMGTSIHFANDFDKIRLPHSTRFVIEGTLLGFYLAWIASNFLADITISIILIKSLYDHRSSTRKKSFRCTLSRLLTLTINTFSLTSLAAFASLSTTILPHIVPNISGDVKNHCQMAAFALTGFLPRIYLASFFFSFAPVDEAQGESPDSCVASLKASWSETSLHPTFREAQDAFQAVDFQLAKFKARKTRVQVIRAVEFAFEGDHFTKDNLDVYSALDV